MIRRKDDLMVTVVGLLRSIQPICDTNNSFRIDDRVKPLETRFCGDGLLLL